MTSKKVDRVEQARKAGVASGESRRIKNDLKERDRLILLCFEYLSASKQSMEIMKRREKIAMHAAMWKLCGGIINPSEDISPLRFIAEAKGITKQRVQQIVKKQKKLQI